MTDTGRPDPFEALRRPDAPIAPSGAFARRLRQQLAAALAGTPTPTTTTATTTPAGSTTMTITPYLIVRGAAAAIDFYRDALGAVEAHRLVGDDGRVGHAELTIGGARLMLADEFPELDIVGPQSRGGATCTFDLQVGSPDRVDSTFERAVALGSTALRPPADQFHGSRSATIADPFGHRWTFSALIEELSQEEYAARAAEDTGRGSYELVVPDAPAADAPPGHHQLRHHETGDLYYFTLPTADLPRAQRFFGALLGWQFEGPTRGHIENISAPPGGLGGSPADAGPRLWFVVDDIQRAVAAVRELGGTAEEPVEYPSGWSADCTDDQGTPFSITVPSAAYSL